MERVLLRIARHCQTLPRKGSNLQAAAARAAAALASCSRTTSLRCPSPALALPPTCNILFHVPPHASGAHSVWIDVFSIDQNATVTKSLDWYSDNTLFVRVLGCLNADNDSGGITTSSALSARFVRSCKSRDMWPLHACDMWPLHAYNPSRGCTQHSLVTVELHCCRVQLVLGMSLTACARTPQVSLKSHAVHAGCQSVGEANLSQPLLVLVRAHVRARTHAIHVWLFTIIPRPRAHHHLVFVPRASVTHHWQIRSVRVRHVRRRHRR